MEYNSGNQLDRHPHSIFQGAVEWWREEQHGLGIAKPAFVEYAEAVLHHTQREQGGTAWSAARRKALETLGITV